MKLKKRQREHLLAGIAEGLETGELNKRAAKFKPPYSVTRQQVDYFRKTRKVDLNAIKADDEQSALKTGLALKENRVSLLKDLAEALRADLLEKQLLWTQQSKGIGSGENYERIDYLEFNTAEVAQLRGVLDDLAAEVGERVKKQEVTGRDGSPLIPKKLDLNDLPSSALQALADGEDAMKVLMRYVLAARH